jgi:hypothetical protein
MEINANFRAFLKPSPPVASEGCAFAMGHEVSLFRGPSGLERAKEIIERMHTHDIPPTPPNYEIWTGYVAGSPPELCREIETRLTR